MKPKLQGSSWTEFQNNQLIRLLKKKVHPKEIAKKMNRSEGSVYSRIKLLTFNNKKYRKLFAIEKIKTLNEK